MASLLHSESRRLYSWWWDSHISPKNSKWLQENLTDMDAKVKAMIKLIEEDADSFARRAEMYYKKRPELMKLVEEFYRAYRALAERYDHATVELHQAHRTMAEAFPSQVPYMLSDDSPASSSGPQNEPHTPEMTYPIRALFDPDNFNKDALDLSSSSLNSMKRNGGYPEDSVSGISRRGLKQLQEMFTSGEMVQDGSSQLSCETKKVETHVRFKSKHAGITEDEVQTLKKTLVEVQAEKEATLLQYQQCLEKLSNLERELNQAQKAAERLDEQANRAESDVKILKEALSKLEADRDAVLLQYNQSLERISSMETMISVAEEDAKGMAERAIKAENESENLKQELSKLETEKEAGILQYKLCLEKIFGFQNQFSLAEENVRMLSEQRERAETEVRALKQALAKLKQEKAAADLQYNQSLETISKMESELLCAGEDAKRLNSELIMEAARLKGAEEQNNLLEKSNQSLQLEAENLAQKIAMKDQQLFEKNNELEKLQLLVQDEHSRFLQVEATVQCLQNLQSQSQEEQRVLVLELKNGLQSLKESEMCRHGLEEELQQVKEESQILNEQNFSSTISIKIMQDEIFSLREMKEKLEDQVAAQVNQSNALQQEIYHLEEEINGLNRRYHALIAQVESVGFNPECLESSVKDLQDENSRLKEICKKDREETESLYERLKEKDELLKKNSVSESSLSELNCKLEGARERLEELQVSCQLLQGEKSSLVSEKANLLSQLLIMTQNMQNLLEKNTSLENSLSGVNVELISLREKSRSLEEMCQLLKNEKSDLLTEKTTLVSQLGNVEQRLGNLEKRFTMLEETYAGLEKEKESTICLVEELRISLSAEKQERANFVLSSELRLAGLEEHVHLLQEESRSAKKGFELELDKAVNAQVEIFILQKFVEDLEEKNLSLLLECRRHVEASKLSNKLISELESENLEQHAEAEFLFDELEKLRSGINQVFKALQPDPENSLADNIAHDQIPLQHIMENVEDLKCSLLRNKDEKQQLLVENSVLFTLLGQLRIESAESDSVKEILEQQCEVMKEQYAMLQKDKHELLEMNKKLRLEVSKGEQQEELLKVEIENQQVELANLQNTCMVLQEENSKALDEKESLLMRFSDLKQESFVLEQENTVILHEAVALSNLSLVFKSFGVEKAAELKALAEELNSIQVMNINLKKELEILEEKLVMKESENVDLSVSFEKLDKELQEVRDLNSQLNHQHIIENDFLRQKATELSEAEQKLRASEKLNMELRGNIDQLKREFEESKLLRSNAAKQILELSESNKKQSEEIECLVEMNKSLESELDVLHMDVEERRVREENLNLELRERFNEFELWEAEASTFYFDFQISAIHDVLLQDKVYELTGVCKLLEDETATKSLEIEDMKTRVGSLERETAGLRAQLSSYVPVIASLADDIASLEHNTLLGMEFHLEDNQEEKGVDMTAPLPKESCQEVGKDQNVLIHDGISNLQKMQARIKAVENAVVEKMERLTMQGRINHEINIDTSVNMTEKLKSEPNSEQGKETPKEEMEVGYEMTNNLESQKTKPEFPEARNGTLMKDIQLDQNSDCSFYGPSKREGRAEDEMLELWETAEQDCTIDPFVSETQSQAIVPTRNDIVCHHFYDVGQKGRDPSLGLQVEKELGVDKLEISTIDVTQNLEGNKRKISERLAADAKKLTTLQTAVQELKRRIEVNKMSKMAKDIEFETVRRHVQQVEEAVMQLVDINNQLTKNIEEGSPLVFGGRTSVELEEAENVQFKGLAEQAQKTSETIGGLQFEVQNIEFVLVKLEGENKSKGKNRVSETKSSILFRNFISGSQRRSRRRKKACLCACMRPSTNGD